MHETPIGEAAAVALDVRLHGGFAAAIDEAAAAANRRHAFLKRAWFEADGNPAGSTLVAARPDGRVIAALPLVPAGPRLLGLCAVAGCYWPFRSFPVAADASDGEVEAFLTAPAARRALGRAWRLGPVMPDDPTVKRLIRAAPRCGFSVLERSAGTAFLLDVAGEAEPWPRASTLRNLHKHEKRLAKLGETEWRLVSGRGWTAEAFDALAEIERNSWLPAKGDADPKFLDPARRRRWETMVADPALAEMLSVGILSIGRRPVAFSFGIDVGETRYCIATSYDGAFSKHSPGYVTGYRTYMAAAERGVRMLNLGVGDKGEKSSMGAAPAAAMSDYLFVRGLIVAAAVRRFLSRSGH